MVLPNQKEIITKIKGIVFNEEQDVLIEAVEPYLEIPFGTEVFVMKETMILLLDIDGVLIKTPSWKQDEIDIDGYSKFDTECVENLNILLEKRNIEIWISSSRRKTKSLEELNVIFSIRGINKNIVGCLPVYKKRMSRKVEIEEFLAKKGISNFLILDDDKSLNALDEALKKRLVLTEYLKGFNAEKLKEAIEKL